MTKLLDWLERRFGRFAIPNVTIGLIVGQVLVYLVVVTQGGGRGGDLISNIELVPNKVLAGEVWRVLTYLFVPPTTSSFPIWALIFWWIFYFMGGALETQWGAFRYNMFLLIGFLASVAASFLQPEAPADNIYLEATVFLAFARLYPDFQFLLFFLVPVKVKWLAMLQWALYALLLITGDMTARLMVIASVANYLLFFGGEHIHDLKADARRKSFQAKAVPRGRMRHTCRVCGRNSDDEPKTSFRYCSKCTGQSCYCPDHIQDHEHVAEKSA